jgi:hypothetical protein
MSKHAQKRDRGETGHAFLFCFLELFLPRNAKKSATFGFCARSSSALYLKRDFKSAPLPSFFLLPLSGATRETPKSGAFWLFASPLCSQAKPPPKGFAVIRVNSKAANDNDWHMVHRLVERLRDRLASLQTKNFELHVRFCEECLVRSPSVKHCTELIEGELSKMGVDDDEAAADFVFGEIVARGFMSMLHLMVRRWTGSSPPNSFCDIGSGTGGAVVVAAASGMFTAAMGIELIKPLHDAGLVLADTVRDFR